MKPILLATQLLTDTNEINIKEIVLEIVFKFIGVIEGVIVIVVGLILTRFLKGYFSRIETKHEQQKTALNLLEKITNGFFIIVSVTLGLKVMGLDLTLIVSVLTLGVSFGLRDVIKNYVAGLLILFKSPFEIGDIVHIRTFTGIVEKIDFQSVTLRTFDHKEITIHNSDLLTQPITNYSKHDKRRLEIVVPLGYGSDVQRAVKIFQLLLENHSEVLKAPKYSIIVKEFDENCMKVFIRFWVARTSNPLRIRSELSLSIQETFDEEKIFAPYSRQTEPINFFTVTPGRKERLVNFYQQPMLGVIAEKVAVAVATATVPVNGDGSVAVPTSFDAEEPE